VLRSCCGNLRTGARLCPKPLQEPPARANPVMGYPSAAGFLLLTGFEETHWATSIGSGACLVSHWRIYELIGIRLGKAIKRDDPCGEGTS
jgi:hypothetical protein